MAWWQQLSERDKRVLLFGSVIATLLFFYAFVLEPAGERGEDLQAQLQTKQQLLKTVTDYQQRLQTYRNAGFAFQQKSPGQGEMSIVRNVLKKHGLNTYAKVGQDGDNITINMKMGPFDAANKALRELWLQHHIKVVSFSAKRLPVQGAARISVTLG